MMSDRKFWILRAVAIFAAMIVVAALVVLFADSSDASKRRSGCVPIVHKSMIPGYDENSIRAAFAARGKGVWLDTDLRFSSQGSGYMFHDNDMRQKTTGVGFIETSTDAVINAARYDRHGAIIAPLSRYLRASGNTRIVMEIKSNLDPVTPTEVRTLADAINAAHARKRVYVGGTPEVIKVLNNHAPGLRTFWRPHGRALTIPNATARGYNMVMANASQWGTAAKVTRFKRHGFLTGARLANRPASWKALYDLGIRRIQTNRPWTLKRWC